jgi:hypothetical protein
VLSTHSATFLGLPKSLILVLATLGCGSPPEPSPPPSAPPSPVARRADGTLRWGLVELAEIRAVVELYDPERWQPVNGGTFTVLEHAASRSVLVLRVWRATRLVRPVECEAEARLARPSLPRVNADSIIDERPLEAPSEFSGSVVVGVEPSPTGATRGYALAVGAAVGRCFVLAFETSADGNDAAGVVGDRLRAAADRIAPSVQLHRVDERVRPERELK